MRRREEAGIGVHFRFLFVACNFISACLLLKVLFADPQTSSSQWPEYGSNPFVFPVAEPVLDEQFFVVDLNGDSLLDFTFRSREKVYAYDHYGSFLWQVPVPDPGGENTGTKHAAADIDGDGHTEIVALNRSNQILIIDGFSGTVEDTISLPLIGSNNRWIHLQVVNLRGQGKRDVIVQTMDTTGVFQSVYINRNLLAFDLENKKELWRVLQDDDAPNGIYEGYWGVAHGSFQCADIDGDGRDEVVGGNMVDDDGTVIDLGYPREWIGIGADGYIDHLDALAIGDYRPDIPGLEWLTCEEDGVDMTDWHTTLLSTSGVLWRQETQLFSGKDQEPQSVLGGDFDLGRSFLEVFARSRFNGPDYSQHPWLFDAFATEFADWITEEELPEGFNTHENGNKEGLEMIAPIDWYGGRKDYIAAKARHVHGNIGVFDAITGQAVWYTPRDFPETRATLIYVADVAGDEREEVIIYDENGNIQIYWNQEPNHNNDKPRKWEDPLYSRLKQNWNYYSPGGYVQNNSSSQEQLTLITPDGGEKWYSGNSYSIIWLTDESVEFVNLDYSVDNGDTWQAIARQTADDGDYTWTIPDTSANHCLVRISDADDDDPWDVSDASFSIVQGAGEMQITINCDDEYQLWVNGDYIGENDQWDVAQTYIVSLQQGRNLLAVYGRNRGSGPGGLIAEVSVEDEVVFITDESWRRLDYEESGWNQLNYDDSHWLHAISHGQYGVEPWGKGIAGFPDDSPAEWIWSEDLRDEQNIGYFRGTFDYQEPVPQITVTSPNGGEQWVKNNSYEIQWSSSGNIDSVKIEYSLNNGSAYQEISSATENDGSYFWHLPDTTADSCLIRIADASNPSVSDHSDEVFSIISGAGAEIHLLNPNGGENWAAGYSQVFFWDSSPSTQSVKLEYSVDDGLNWKVIADPVENKGRYTWIVPHDPTEQGLVRITDSNNAELFDVSDAAFSIFELEDRSVDPDIPKPMTLTIDDVGWQLGKDDSDSNGPYRLGTNRNPVLEDYQVLVYVAQHVGTRLCAKFILSEFDRENLLADYPTTTEQGENWDNSALTGPQDYDFMNYVKENAAWLELGLHGVRHEYWDWVNRNGQMKRTEFYNEREEQAWPYEDLQGHLEALQKILQLYQIYSFPRSFVTPGNGYYYHSGSNETTGALVHPFGVKYAASNIIRAGSYGVPQEVIQKGGTIDSGVLWIQQAADVPGWPDWNAVAAVPNSFPEDGLPITHWPNWWAEDPGQNFTVGDQFIDWFDQVKNNPDWYVPKNNAQYFSQWLYRNYTQVEKYPDSIQIDNSSMPDQAYEYKLLGNLVFKFQLSEGEHLSSATIDNDAEIVGYYEEMGYGYLILSQLGQRSYHLDYSIGSSELPTYVLNDGTYNVFSFQTYSDSAVLKIEMFGSQKVKVKLQLKPEEVTSLDSDLVIQSFSFDEEKNLLIIDVQGNDIMGSSGEIVVRGAPIEPELTVTSPNGGESWAKNSTQTITWTTSGSIDSVGLFYSLDAGDHWLAITPGVYNDGEYQWTVPDTTSDQALIKVVSSTDDSIADLSDSLFAIVSQAGEMEIVIDCDDEYELWVNGDYVGSDVLWDVAQSYTVPMYEGENVLAVHGINRGGPGGLILEVQVNEEVVLVTDESWLRNEREVPGWNDVGCDDSDWLTAVSHGQYGVEPWGYGIAGFPESSKAEWIWSEDLKDEQREWYFRGRFIQGEPVPAPEISSFTPDSGRVGTEVTVFGNHFVNVRGVKFSTVDADSYRVDSETQLRSWVPQGAGSGPISVTTSGGTAQSSDSFVVLQTPELTLLVPNGGEQWPAGSIQTVQWDGTGGISTVSLDYSLDHGIEWVQIVANTENDGAYDWEVPDTVSEEALIRVTAVEDSALSDQSDSVFAIVGPSIQMTITINCDDRYRLWVNGNFLGENDQWDVAQTYTAAVLEGENVLAVHGWNRGSGAHGVIAEVSIDERIVLRTDSDWLRFDSEVSGWTGLNFDDSSWLPPVDFGPYGVDPWGRAIQGFPPESQAHWIWGESISETFLRGHFVYTALSKANPAPSHIPSSQDSIETVREEFILAENYPNPVRKYTTILYQIPKQSPVTIIIYNLSGRIVRTLVQTVQSSGTYRVTWDGRDHFGNPVGSGIYFYQSNAGNLRLSKKLLVIR